MAAKLTKVVVVGRPTVLLLEGKCTKVKRRVEQGYCATLSLNLEIELPNGQRFRGGGDRMAVRVYPLPMPSAGRPRNKKKIGARKKVRVRATPAAAPG